MMMGARDMMVTFLVGEDPVDKWASEQVDKGQVDKRIAQMLDISLVYLFTCLLLQLLVHDMHVWVIL